MRFTEVYPEVSRGPYKDYRGIYRDYRGHIDYRDYEGHIEITEVE